MNIRRMEKVVAEGFATTYNHLGGKLGVIIELDAEMTPERLERAKEKKYYLISKLIKHIK